MRFGGKLMKKKVLILLVVAVLALAPAAAAQYKGASEEGTWGVGLNLGTNTGVAIKYGYGDFDIFGNVGFDFLNLKTDPFRFSIGVDVGISYEVYDADFGGGHHMPITVGLMFPMGFIITDGSMDFNLGVLAQAGLEYQIPDVPIAFYLRLGVGLDMLFGSSGLEPGPGFSGAIGVMYVF